MRALVVVRGEVDERDIWPFASVLDRDEAGTRLMVKAHDPLELVGALQALLARRLEIVSMQVTPDPSGRTERSGDYLERPNLEAGPEQGSCRPVPRVTTPATEGMQDEAVRCPAPHDPGLTRPPCGESNPLDAWTSCPTQAAGSGP